MTHRMCSVSKARASETISGFDFPLPEAMPLSLNRARLGWWKAQYRQAVIELRKRGVELAASRSLHQKALKREVTVQG